MNFKNGGHWLVTGDSNVSNVDFSGGIINMTQNSKGNAHQVSIDNALNGSGTFMMDLKYLGNSVDAYKMHRIAISFIFTAAMAVGSS